MTDTEKATAIDLLAEVDRLRADATAAIDQEGRSDMGQFMTPLPVAQLMASMLGTTEREVCLLDPGAGFGSLTAASVAALLARETPPERISAVAYEVDPILIEYLARTFEICEAACELSGVAFTAHVEATDFLAAALALHLRGEHPFNCAILNPPYRKIASDSDARATCRALGFEASNLYAAFVGATIRLLGEGGEIVAITPRSFANGPYFRSYRGFMLRELSLRRLHVFDSRTEAFRDDAVLQENVILHAEKRSSAPESVTITASAGPNDAPRSRSVPWGRVVYEHDPEEFIHIIETDAGDAAAEQIRRFDTYLHDLDIAVSTGPVVDFRATSFLRKEPEEGAVPLLYPTHLTDGSVLWPHTAAKWNALAIEGDSLGLTVPNGHYVLVKRFTAKEERRRVVASLYHGDHFDAERVAFENHLNFFHDDGRGLPINLACGLASYLNSTLVDTYFRQFSGHTQVNAADLRNLPYPPRERLEALGEATPRLPVSQAEIDEVSARYLLT